MSTRQRSFIKSIPPPFLTGPQTDPKRTSTGQAYFFGLCCGLAALRLLPLVVELAPLRGWLSQLAAVLGPPLRPNGLAALRFAARCSLGPSAASPPRSGLRPLLHIARPNKKRLLDKASSLAHNQLLSNYFMITRLLICSFNRSQYIPAASFGICNCNCCSPPIF
ncbi:hypothetical protein SapgrDRAFT_2360 [Saprospira grandis DSM 2844]|uniref:Uncharacterized protein n=1 Tax=Saprospira grandis DSM 2844 TaxID=694433 RepID=J0XY21_9BACT|nr:hypothetical protein SapgrDRAFT_2360 [Saprospira grandis DSM 2844]